VGLSEVMSELMTTYHNFQQLGSDLS